MDLKKEVKNISELANIKIPVDKIEKFADEFGRILAYMDTISTIPQYKASDTKRAEHYTPLRKDEARIDYKPVRPSEGRYYRVPKVI